MQFRGLGLDSRHKTAVVVLQFRVNWTNKSGHRLLLRTAHRLDRQQELVSAPKP